MNPYHNFDRKMSLFNQNDQNSYNYQKQKEFIYKQKQWIKQIESKYHHKKQNYNNPYKSKLLQQKPHILVQNKDVNNQMQLAKTVKHKNYRECLNNDNKSQITTKIVYYDKDQEKRAGKYPRARQSQTNILSISQIKRLQKQSVDQTKIHKIASSSSKNKSRTSGSNQSKLSQKIDKLQNSAASRYNKYINNQPLLNINIDLRKQVIEQTMSGQILRNNLNKRRIQRIQKISTFQGFNQKRQSNNEHQNKIYPVQKQFQERQLNKDKGYQFQRSRSNLSKYCQLQQSKSRVTLSNKKQDPVTGTNSNIKVITPRKVSINEQVKNNKIHKICSSNYKSKDQCQQKKFFSQRKIQYDPKQSHRGSQKRVAQTPRSKYQIQDIFNYNLQPRQISYKDKKTNFNIRQDYLQEIPIGVALTSNPSKKARIKLSIFKK